MPSLQHSDKFCHSFIQSLLHTVIIYYIIHQHVQEFIHSFVHSCIHSFVRSFTRSLAHSRVCSLHFIASFSVASFSSFSSPQTTPIHCFLSSHFLFWNIPYRHLAGTIWYTQNCTTVQIWPIAMPAMSVSSRL